MDLGAGGGGRARRETVGIRVEKVSPWYPLQFPRGWSGQRCLRDRSVERTENEGAWAVSVHVQKSSAAASWGDKTWTTASFRDHSAPLAMTMQCTGGQHPPRACWVKPL